MNVGPSHARQLDLPQPGFDQIDGETSVQHRGQAERRV